MALLTESANRGIWLIFEVLFPVAVSPAQLLNCDCSRVPILSQPLLPSLWRPPLTKPMTPTIPQVWTPPDSCISTADRVLPELLDRLEFPMTHDTLACKI